MAAITQGIRYRKEGRETKVTLTASHGWARYGDLEYVPHVLRYYSGDTNIFAGLFGNTQIVSIEKNELGNAGGQKFWSWYGFSQREELCRDAKEVLSIQSKGIVEMR